MKVICMTVFTTKFRTCFNPSLVFSQQPYVCLNFYLLIYNPFATCIALG